MRRSGRFQPIFRSTGEQEGRTLKWKAAREACIQEFVVEGTATRAPEQAASPNGHVAIRWMVGISERM